MQLENTFLGIPVELRLEIYKHVLTLDRSPESPPSAIPYQNWHLQILRLNKQIRAEALRVLQKTNAWIAVGFIANTGQQLASMMQTMRKPQAFMTRPSLAIKRDEKYIFPEVCLKFWLGRPYGRRNGGGSEHSRRKLIQLRLFAYNRQAWANFCLDLWEMRQHSDRSMAVDIRQLAPSWTAQDFEDKVLFPEMQLRGLSNIVIRPSCEDYQMQEVYMKREVSTAQDRVLILNSHKMKGNSAMTRKNFVDAMWYYGMGLNYCCTFYERWHWDFVLFEPVGESLRFCNLAWSLKVDLCNNFVLAWSKLAESRRSRGQQNTPEVQLAQFEKALEVSNNALEWPGILDEQRCKAHYIRGLAHMGRGEYGELHREGRTVTVRYFKEAAKEFYYASCLRRADPAITAAIARVHGKLKRASVGAPLKEVSKRSLEPQMAWSGGVVVPQVEAYTSRRYLQVARASLGEELHNATTINSFDIPYPSIP